MVEGIPETIFVGVNFSQCMWSMDFEFRSDKNNKN